MSTGATGQCQREEACDPECLHCGAGSQTVGAEVTMKGAPGAFALGGFDELVEAAGIEPASASPTQSGLHA